MTKKVAVYPGPSSRIPLASAKLSSGENCVLFEDATIGLESVETPDNSGYHMINRRAPDIISLEFEQGNSPSINRLIILASLIVPYLFLWLSIRSHIPYTISPSSFMWTVLILFPLVAYYLFKRLTINPIQIIAHHIAEEEPQTIDLQSEKEREASLAAGAALIIAFSSFMAEDADLISGILCDALLFTFVIGCVIENSPLMRPLPSFIPGDRIPVEHLSPKEFYYLASDLIEQKKDEIKSKKPIEELVAEGEHERLEFKGSFWTDSTSREKNLLLRDAVVKEIAGFLNSEFGGTLLIGISNDFPFDPTRLVERDIELIGDQDKLERHIGDILSRDLLVDYSAGLWTIRFLPFRGEKIIRIDVPRQAPKPILAYQPNEQKKKGGDVKKEFRFVRSGSKTQPKSPSSWATYILDHWGKSR